MKKHISLTISALLLSTPLAAATAPKQAQPEPAWDADLFRKDVQCMGAHVSFLYWTVDMRALDYAVQMQSPAGRDNADGQSPSYIQGNIQNASYNMDPGFRLALTYYRAPKNWEVWGQYTRLTARGRNDVGKPSEGPVFLTGSWPQVTTLPLSGAHSYIHMNYNVFDMLADRNFHPNEHLRLRMMGGAMVAWIDQNWFVKYTDSSNNNTNVQNFWRFIGGGLQGGIMVDWFWTSDIYMTALFTSGALMGSYVNKSKVQYNSQTPVQDAEYSDVHPAFTVRGMFGPSWQKNFTNNRVEVFAGYEITFWGNLHEIFRSTGGTPSQSKQIWIDSGLIALQGLTTRITVDF